MTNERLTMKDIPLETYDAAQRYFALHPECKRMAVIVGKSKSPFEYEDIDIELVTPHWDENCAFALKGYLYREDGE